MTKTWLCCILPYVPWTPLHPTISPTLKKKRICYSFILLVCHISMVTSQKHHYTNKPTSQYSFIIAYMLQYLWHGRVPTKMWSECPFPPPPPPPPPPWQPSSKRHARRAFNSHENAWLVTSDPVTTTRLPPPTSFRENCFCVSLTRRLFVKVWPRHHNLVEQWLPRIPGALWCRERHWEFWACWKLSCLWYDFSQQNRDQSLKKLLSIIMSTKLNKILLYFIMFSKSFYKGLPITRIMPNLCLIRIWYGGSSTSILFVADKQK